MRMMPYTQIALHWIASAIAFALTAFVARRSKSDAQAMFMAVVLGLALGYVLSAAIGLVATYYPLGYFDPWIAAKLKQFGLIK